MADPIQADGMNNEELFDAAFAPFVNDGHVTITRGGITVHYCHVKDCPDGDS